MKKPSWPFSNSAILRSSALVLVAMFVLAASVSAQSIYRSTARPLDEMASAFPFDIELLQSEGLPDTVRITTDQLLAANLGKRKTVMLFWLTTCQPCRQELSDLEQVLPTWQDQVDFSLVPVSIDFPRRAAAFHQRADAYPWPSYLDVDREFPVVLPGNLNGVPQVFVFDEQGQQVFHKRKYMTGDLDALAAVLGVQQ